MAGAIVAGRYRIIELLGRGGMGEVFRADDLTLRQPVALKFLPLKLAGDPAAVERIRGEVTLARQVSHPNVCRVHDLGEADGQPFISMEFVAGEDLATLLRRIGRPAGEKALDLARQIAAGLAAAHAAGVIHRDLKPANIMLDRAGRVRISDFGLALPGDAAAGARELAGTIAYMAPEQLAGAGASAKSDLYSLGLVLYELLTGKHPSPAASLSDALRRRRDSEPAPPSELVREIDPAVEAVILHCLARAPEQRPESALAVLAALSGGDAVRAALAAGQTPSPSAVAAAPSRGALAPAPALACFATVLVSLIVYLTLGGRLSVVEIVAPPLPPAVLAAKARELAERLGAPAQPADEAYGLAYDALALRLASRPPEAEPPATVAAAKKQMITFWYRASQAYIIPANPIIDVGPGDALREPGDVVITLEPSGRLRTFQLQPTGEEHEPSASPLARTDALRLAAFEPAGCQQAQPTRIPATFATRREAWQCTSQADGGAATVEMSWRESRLVELSVTPTWAAEAGKRGAAARAAGARDALDVFVVSLLLLAIPFAWHNLRRKRGDRHGARRLALVVFTGYLVAQLISIHHVPAFGEERTLLVTAVAYALYFAATTALLYTALEPFVRRLWPERLISWTRLLAGDLRDAMVARDVLIGTTVCLAVAATGIVTFRLAAPTEFLPIGKALAPLAGALHCLGAVSSAVAGAVRFGLLFLLLLLLLRVLSRGRWIVPAAFFAIMTTVIYGWLVGAIGSTSAGVAFLALISSASWLLLLGRFGLLATVTALFFEFLALQMPDATRLTGWYAGPTWWIVATIVLASAYGLYFSTGGKPFGSGNLIEKKL
ncbi:MAG: protein kinase, partial [Acidobacteriota bacterium]